MFKLLRADKRGKRLVSCKIIKFYHKINHSLAYRQKWWTYWQCTKLFKSVSIFHWQNLFKVPSNVKSDENKFFFFRCIGEACRRYITFNKKTHLFFSCTLKLIHVNKNTHFSYQSSEYFSDGLNKIKYFQCVTSAKISLSF